jgi:hypothetical protein
LLCYGRAEPLCQIGCPPVQLAPTLVTVELIVVALVHQLGVLPPRK